MKDLLLRQKLLEQLKKTPIVQIACERAGVGRATFYRWKKQSASFAKQADEALREGILLINDMAESQLMNAIKDRNMTAIIFWLKSRHSSYASKLELSGNVTATHQLTPRQRELIKRAVELAKAKENNS